MLTEKLKSTTERLQSLDLFRGLIMFLLVAEGAGIYSSLDKLVGDHSVWGSLIQQFHHHPWNGLRFWDLVQPFFMFIVGVAMAFSLQRRWSSGATRRQTTIHILKRCLVLFLLGVMLHCGYSGRLIWELWNVLTQLSVTILISYFIFNWSMTRQIVFSLGLLLVMDLVYRFFPVTGYNQPFVADQNIGSWMDLQLMGHLSSGHWVAINCLPTTAHTIWGVLTAKVLQSQRRDWQKIYLIGIAGLIGLIMGYALNWSGVTPIIKRICTSAFILASGGWCLLAVAVAYWLVDVVGWRRWTSFFVIVGMNPIFIYLFSETVGGQWVNRFVGIFTVGLLSAVGVNELVAHVGNALVVLGLEWSLCYWLYQRRIFFKI